MFLKNEKGEIVNINKIAAVKTNTNARNLHGELEHHIDLYTEHGHGIRFSYKTEDEFINNYRAIQEILINGPKHNQRPWTDTDAKWICTNDSMVRINQIECIEYEGWVVTVHMDNAEINFWNHSDADLIKCLNNFEFNLKGVGRLINLSNLKDGG